jgi:serine/threonine protein kinase
MTNPLLPEDALSPLELDHVIARCDRFEAAWKANAPIAIEHELAEAPAAIHPRLFRELLALDLELRRKRGDRPTEEEYRVRFPDQAAAIAGAFAETAPAPAPARGRPVDDQHRLAAQNLLFGLLAFQNGFIDRDALLGAFSAWVADKSRALGDLLRERRSLDAARYDLIAALVGEHLKLHGGDPEASLAALSSVDSVRHDLEQTVDPVILSGVSVVGTARGEHDAAGACSPGSRARRAGDRFRILRFHRKGGLGQIHVAQPEELGREVALKEILPEKADSDHLRSRFVLEAEINGGLEHPGIVPIYSLGHYADGKPFFAMRFVEGDSVKEAIEAYHRAHPHADPSTVEFRKLLARFIDVCETIAYAHSRGVLHRDLKPTNIMLGRYGEALIIDWGLAKATGRRAKSDAEHPEATLVPASGDSRHPTIGVLGSPRYMSPEQARGEIDTLGPATDVYGLGATLYHLLTGRPPIEVIDGESIDLILEKVRAGAIAPPRSCNSSIPVALEAICLKALALRPGDRFSSVKALAEDVEHWLADEPVTARPDSALARASRWGRKHSTAVASLGMLLKTGLAASSAGLVLINEERIKTGHALDRALKAEGQATANLASAREQGQRAKQSEAEARAVLSFFQDKVLAAGRPEDQDGGLGPEVTLRKALDKAEASVAGQFADQPTVEASLRSTMGESYRLLGDFQRAMTQHERATVLRTKNLGPDHPATLTSMSDLALAHKNVGRFAEAISLYEDTLSRRRAMLGSDHAATLNTMNNLSHAYRVDGRFTDALNLL